MNLPSCDPESVQTESAAIDFKGQFDPTSKQDWCEVVKDIVAMANSGGGCILVGVTDAGTPSGHNVGPVLLLDAADITNKIHGYTEVHYSAFDVCEGARQGSAVAVIRVGGVRLPMVFTSPGTYPIGPKEQKTAFARGTVYFRHGSKSEPGTSADLAATVEREIERLKEFWLDGIAKVVAAPPGSAVQVIKQDAAVIATPDAAPIRLSADANAPLFRAIQADRLYPYRQKELIERLRALLAVKVTGHDLLCVRRVYNIDANPTFSFMSHWSPRQYSDAFVEWIVAQHTADADFFRKARDVYRQSGLAVSG